MRSLSRLLFSGQENGLCGMKYIFFEGYFEKKIETIQKYDLSKSLPRG
jgi:hypothetical protein